MASLIFQSIISGSIKKDGNVLEINKMYLSYDTDTEVLQRMVVATNNQTVLLDKRQMRQLQFRERNIACERIRDNEIASRIRALFA
jgi:uncharacterized transporter YbjL